MSENKLSRRDLLRTGAVLTLAPAVVPLVEAGLQDKAPPAGSSCPPGGGSIPLSNVRNLFAFSRANPLRVPMNAANLCPTFECITELVDERTADLDRDVSFQNRQTRYFPLLNLARQRVADQIGIADCDLALVRNTSEANNIIANGIPLNDGDKVLLWTENHPTNYHSWFFRRARELANRRNISIVCVTLPTPAPGRDLTRQMILDTFRPLIERHKPRVVAFSEVSNVSGVRLPAREICARAHQVRQDTFVHVDGAQSWGALHLDLDDMGCDSFSASAHKWYCGPRETGILYIRRKWLQNEGALSRFWPSVIAYDLYIALPCQEGDIHLCQAQQATLANDVVLPDAGMLESWTAALQDCQLDCNLWKFARRFETLGQRDDAAITALAETADLHRRIGPANIQRFVAGLANSLKSRLRECRGVTVTTPMNAEVSHAVVVAQLPNETGAIRAYNELYTAGIAGARSGNRGIRLCPHMYNNESDIQAAVAVIRRVAGC